MGFRKPLIVCYKGRVVVLLVFISTPYRQVLAKILGAQGGEYLHPPGVVGSGVRGEGLYPGVDGRPSAGRGDTCRVVHETGEFSIHKSFLNLVGQLSRK